MAEQAADTTIFQRTPNFSLPAGNRPLTDEEIADRKANYRQWRQAQRVRVRRAGPSSDQIAAKGYEGFDLLPA